VINPSGEDLAAGHDPVLAAAIKNLGGNISPADAGKIFRMKWTETSKGENQIEIETK
jgi:hypothetical protein